MCGISLKVAFKRWWFILACPWGKLSSAMAGGGLVCILLMSADLRAETIEVLTYEESPFAVKVGRTHQGLLVDLLKEMFSRTGLDYKLKFIPLKRAIITTERMPGHCVLPVARSQEPGAGGAFSLDQPGAGLKVRPLQS